MAREPNERNMEIGVGQLSGEKVRIGIKVKEVFLAHLRVMTPLNV